MTLWTLAFKSLWFYRRQHGGVVLGAAAATAILVGALAVGDCVRYSLERMALARLGNVTLALPAGERLVRQELAGELAGDLHTDVAAVLIVPGSALQRDSGITVDGVQILGVDDSFWKLGPQAPNGSGPSHVATSPNTPGVILNYALASKLKARVGQNVLLRVQEPSALPRDAILAKADDLTAALNLPVTAIVGAEQLGSFNLHSDPTSPLNAFVPLALLANTVGAPGKANLLLVGSRSTAQGGTASESRALGTSRPWAATEPARPTSLTPFAALAVAPKTADQALRRHWQLADAGVELRHLTVPDAYELWTGRVFLEDAVVKAVDEAIANPRPARVLTYFVNELRAGERTTPYSMVSALDPAALTGTASGAVAGLRDDQIAVNQWLADDLGVKIGDELSLRYYVLGPTRKLEEHSTAFRVAAIIPMDQLAGGSELMPLFPGLHDAASCRDWKPGFGIELDKLRDKDQAYWDQYRGTPKAFITFAAGQKIWANPFGSVTALRIATSAGSAGELESRIRGKLSPAALGLSFAAVQDQALRTARQGTDFGMLFLGLSFFLIFAALLLVGLLFSLSVQRRGVEAGTLLALGLTAGQVRRLMLLEGLILAVLGGVAGTAGGLLYTKAVLQGLSTIWAPATGGVAAGGAETGLQFHVELSTLAIGAAAGVVMAMLTIGWTLWRLGRQPARLLLAGETAAEALPTMRRGCHWPDAESRRIGTEQPTSAIIVPPHGSPSPRAAPAARGTPVSWLIAAVAALGSAVMLALASKGMSDQAGMFFGAAALLLVAVLSAVHAGLVALARRRGSATLSLLGIGLRSASRRRGRSLATVILLACGCFLVVAVGLNRQDPTAHAERRSSGTGGFALFGRTTLPVLFDFNTPDGRRELDLNDSDMKDVTVVPLRVHEGDDASCLSLGRAQAPRLLGVNPALLAQRAAFTFTSEQVTPGAPIQRRGWDLLETATDTDVVNAIGDEQTIVWGLHASVGQILPDVHYTDERGKPFRVRIVGVLANSILQGNLVIAEHEFVARFPSESGWRMLLIDAPLGRAAEVATVWPDLPQLKRLGLELTPARDRLALFSSVEETYLSIFQALGGLGLILGSIGLGAVVLRNVLERRGELAALRAVGLSRVRVALLVLSEHWLLLLAGLICGSVSGALAVWPALMQRGTDLPLVSMGVTLAAVLISGVLWTVLAVTAALSGPLMAALRSE